MNIRPILFSGPMVRALLNGWKTQTRRVLADGPERLMCRSCGCSEREWKQNGCVCNDGDLQWTPCEQPRYRVGDLLYVREHWQVWADYDHLSPSQIQPTSDILFIADRLDSRWDSRFRRGMHMPRWASRLTMKVTDVRVQRLQEISEEDAKAEGCLPLIAENAPEEVGDIYSHVRSFENLWNTINEKRGFGWDVNPWVVAVTFEVHRCNVDSLTDEVAA